MNSIGFWKYRDSNIPIEVGDLVFYGSSEPNNYPANARVVCLGGCCHLCHAEFLTISRFDGMGNSHEHHNDEQSGWYITNRLISLKQKAIRYTSRGNLLALTL